MSETAAQLDNEPVLPVDALDEPVGPSPLDRREAAIKEAVPTRLEELRQDGVEIPSTDADAGEAEAEDGETLEPEGDGAPREPVPGEPLYTVKIDGVERQVPLSDLTAGYKAPNDARRHLEEASQTLRRAREIEHGVLSRTTAQMPPAAQQPPSDELDGIDWSGVAEKLQFGERDDAGNALRNMVVQLRDRGSSSGGAAPSVDQVEMRVLEKIEWTTALNQFGEEYQDILTDPHVGRIAGSIGRALYQQSMQDAQMSGRPRRPYWDIFREAGEKTREWLNGLAGQQAGDSNTSTPPKPNGEQPAVNLSEERGARKRAAPQPPTPRSGTSAVAARSGAQRGKPQKSDEQRHSEGIADIQRARGQR